jgi:hypothetical protein
MKKAPGRSAGRLVVTWDSPGFEALDFYSLDGVLLQSVRLDTGQLNSEQDLAHLAPGTYLARLRGKGVAPRQKLFVVMK